MEIGKSTRDSINSPGVKTPWTFVTNILSTLTCRPVWQIVDGSLRNGVRGAINTVWIPVMDSVNPKVWR